MRNELIVEISDVLKAMDDGVFQDFCGDFLPLYDISYKGLVRHGTTVEGKTRKGTPDLIKTSANGKQIAVECSTQKKYWHAPKAKEKFAKWKPCIDINKCISCLKYLNEIVLCSSQEIPTNMPNVKADLLSYAKERTNAKTSLLCCVNIENYIADNVEMPEMQNLLKTYLPSVYSRIASLKNGQRYQLVLELWRETLVPLVDFVRIIEEATNKFINIKEAKTYALERISELKSHFEREGLPKQGDIVRQLGSAFRLKDPKGSIYCFLGVPKIGKTSLVVQCAANWQSKKYIIHWFDCPVTECETKTLVGDVLRSLWASFLAPVEATQLADGRINVESIDIGTLKYNVNSPAIYVIDNAELLSEEVLKSLCTTLAKLKSLNLLTQIGVIFISNKCLKHLCPAISNEFPSPAWNREELEEFLLTRLEDSTYYQSGSFLDALMTKSGGHPLIALALTKRFPSVEGLLLSTFKLPSLADEDLTADVKRLLFDDILAKDMDSLSYVLRLSPLTFKADEKIMHVIKNKIDPVISKPFSLVLDKLYGTVIEGDKRTGYNVSFVYREVARSQLSLQEQQLILDVVSTELLTPIGKVLDADKITKGVFCALLADKHEKVFYWTTTLLLSAIKNSLPMIQMRAIVERLELFGYIRVPEEPKLLLMYYIMLHLMASVYSRIGYDDKAFELLDKIKATTIECDDKNLRESLRDLTEGAAVYKATVIATKSPLEAIEILSKTELSRIRKSSFFAQPTRDFLKMLFAQAPIRKIPTCFVSKVIDSIDPNDERDVSSVIHMSLDLAARANSEKVNPKEVINLLSAKNDIVEVLRVTFNAQSALETREPKRALDFIEQAIGMLQKRHTWGNTIENIIRLVQGDAYYSLKGNDKAKTSYLRCIECCGDEVGSFEYAWASFRIGLLSDNAADAENFFKQSSSACELLEYDDLYARSEGERGVVLMQMDQPLEFVRIADSLLRRYYIDKKDKYGPTVTIMVAHLGRLKCMIEKKPLPKDEKKDGENVFPEFEKGIYVSVLNIAKPQAENILAFYILGKCYSLLDHYDHAAQAFRTGLSISPNTQLGKECIPAVIRKLLDIIVPEGDAKEIEKLITDCFFLDLHQIALPPGLDYRTYITICVFSKIDSVIAELDGEQQENVTGLLSKVRKTLSVSSLEQAEWWLSELDDRLARIGERFYKQEEDKRSVWKTAFDNALQVDNHRIIIEAGYRLGFSYFRLFRIKDLADMQFSILKSILALNKNFIHVEKIGQDMFKFWQSVEWRRLYDSDSKAKQALLDGAKALKNAGLSPQEAGPIMILLISSIYEYRGNATDWAVSKVEKTGTRSKLSNELMKRIDLYFQ